MNHPIMANPTIARPEWSTIIDPVLQKELEHTGIAQKRRRPLRQALLPLRLPSPVIQALPNESLPVRMRRYFMYFQLIVERLRFHIVEGFRFALEWRRLRRMKELVQ